MESLMVNNHWGVLLLAAALIALVAIGAAVFMHERNNGRMDDADERLRQLREKWRRNTPK